MKKILFILLLCASPISVPCSAMTHILASQQSQSKRIGYVTKKVCGATFTKEDNNLFTKYSVKNDLDAIDRMIYDGRLVILRKGEKVQILEKTIFLVKIKRANGQIVYTDRENVKEQ